MIIRNKHNLNEYMIKDINQKILKSWFVDIYGKKEIFKKNGLNLDSLKKGELENNILFMEDLVRVIKKNTDEKIFLDYVFEITFLDEQTKYENIEVSAIKFVLKNGILLKFIGDVEAIPFKTIKEA